MNIVLEHGGFTTARVRGRVPRKDEDEAYALYLCKEPSCEHVQQRRLPYTPGRSQRRATRSQQWPPLTYGTIPTDDDLPLYLHKTHHESISPRVLDG